MQKDLASRTLRLFLTLSLISSFAASGFASHSWSNYHWARTSNPFTVRVVDSNTQDWQTMYNSALTDWAQSSVLNLTNEQGDESSRARKRCVMIAGKIHSCNASYGFNGWLGLASINISGNHITQATSKMNDSYFSSGSYNSTNRRHVMCQEIGHGFGLGHQDESGKDLNTCMDYANALDNPSPNAHDYTQLETIYSHLDSSTTIAALTYDATFGYGDDPDAPHNWGQLVHQSENGRSSVYERINFNGSRTIRHVFWTQERAERCPGCDHRYHH
jgi:hypothetical protein